MPKILPYQLKTLLDSLAIFVGSWRPKLRLVGDAVPAVDVAIVCCKEPLDVILDTVKAALNTDYPSHRLRLVVSDDGAQPAVAAGVAALQAQHPSRQLLYTARRKTSGDAHKAGNLNHVLRFLAARPGGAAPFLASLDADMIAERRWLRAQLPHLLRDPRLAFTCPPPRFYNVPVDDPLAQSLLVFQRFEEIAKDRVGFPWCTGSGWVMRREALVEVGGFPGLSVTEDLLLGNLILGKGWKAAYALESLQWGLVPDSFHAHVEQRKRWTGQ
ncbi:putative glycosyl protein [Neofusicoccum parvum UCRNP2]|uniref:Putative glycosyl protein n=1 Tax=Botryosphaeria parva (strain UCR-NP2) TaxID=1287680 RepID=R1G0E0_BOTPV|nr:putative glycosyl protein [Neofusicoccum parvum UCRNP2]